MIDPLRIGERPLPAGSVWHPAKHKSVPRDPFSKMLNAAPWKRVLPIPGTRRPRTDFVRRPDYD